jgi:uncharacterized small protein (DUF1192 family)
MKNNQPKRLLEHLQSGRSITRMEALSVLGIFELSSRIGDLQKRGYKINKKRLTVTNRFNEKISIVKYTLDTSS